MSFDPGPLTPYIPPGRIEVYTADGSIRAVFDTEEMDYHVDLSPYADPEAIDAYLRDHIFAMGFELICEDECPAATTDDGWTRIYLVPIEPVDDLSFDPYIKVPRAIRHAIPPRPLEVPS